MHINGRYFTMPAESTVWDKLEAIIRANSSMSQNVADILAIYGTPSASVAVLDNGHISSKCYSTVGDDTETVFQACSISKPVTAMAVMKLVSKGLLSLDNPITDYLPYRILFNLETPETVSLLSHVTIKHLLSHTAGLTIDGFPGYVENQPHPERVLSGKPPSNTLQVRLSGLPGHRFAYSGGGYTVLQLILEHVTNQEFASLMQELVFTPLQMTRSFYSKPTAKNNYASAYYTGYQKTEISFHEYPEQTAAGLWTTPTDLLRMVKALQDSLSADTHEPGFLPQDVARTMLSEVHSGMALGWRAPADGTGFQHSGSNFGFKCNVFGYAYLNFASTLTRDGDEKLRTVAATTQGAQQKAGVCVMTNSEAGYDVVKKIEHAIAFAMGWRQLSDVYKIGRVDIPFRASKYTASINGNDWAEWAGIWANDWEIMDGSLGAPKIRFQNLPSVALHPAALAAEDEASYDFVMEGLEIMVRLKWQGKEQVVELWHGANADITVLRRS